MATKFASCPRPGCGATVSTKVNGEVWCPNESACGVMWPTIKAFDSEVTARGLAGTKEKRYGKEYIEGDGEGSVRDDMAALIRLVKMMTLQDVYSAVDTSIKGREHMISQGGGTSSTKDMRTEIEALDGMREWLAHEIGDLDE